MFRAIEYYDMGSMSTSRVLNSFVQFSGYGVRRRKTDENKECALYNIP